jgi:hypothetical protein
MMRRNRLENGESLLTVGLELISVAVMALNWSGFPGWKRAAVAALLACALIVQGLSRASLASSMPAPAHTADTLAFDTMASLCLHDGSGGTPSPSSPSEHDRSSHDLCCTLICGLGCLTGPALPPGLAALRPPARGEAVRRIDIAQPVVLAPASPPVGARAPPTTS